MPGDSIRTLVMSAEKDAVKRFLSRVHQSWDQLHVETDKVCLKVQKGCISKKRFLDFTNALFSCTVPVSFRIYVMAHA